MRLFALLLLCFGTSLVFSQTPTKKKNTTYSFSTKIKIEDKNGHLITDSLKRQAYFITKQRRFNLIKTQFNKSILTQTAVPLCSNGSFEEFETLSGVNVLKDFRYTTGETLNPIQCKSLSDIASQGIIQYDPANFSIMATTVPANYLDEYIGNINAFDQFSLKINYKDSYVAGSLVQAKRFKTDNETRLKFNYKAVLQTIDDSGHDNEQPYFKARVVNNAGGVVSEFCLIGDVNNCIFSQAPYLESGSLVLYTPNWQSGILDISSIPNNEEFTVEFLASRCGLGAHFGYSYIDDICLLHTNENLQGSIELDPLFKICPALPISVCGNFTIPNSGGISATVTAITLHVRDANNAIVYTSQTPATLDLVNHHFCFDLQAANFPDIVAAGYNVDATISYGLLQTNCTGTSFNTASDDDANPGWDIWFLNCTSCDISLQTTSLTLCDTDHNGKEFFNLSNVEPSIVTPTAGLTFTYYKTLLDATANTNAIANFTNFESSSAALFVRVTQSATCYKIIAIDVIVKNPSASITGILNVCSGSTTLTATPGSSYLWGNGATTQSIVVNSVGNYTVTVTDAIGCQALGTVTILNNLVAVQPTILVTQPTCFSNTGTIEITSPASQYSYDNGLTWSTNSSMSNLPVGTYKIKIKTVAGCTSYSTTISIVPFLSAFPDFHAINPNFCGDVGSITITTPAPFYSFDDGVTWETTNTKNNLPSGTYLIRVKDTFGCISNFNSVVLNGEFLADPLYISDNPYCGVLGSIIITTPAAFYSFDGGITWQGSNTLSNLTSGSYLIKIKDAQGCTSPNVYVYLEKLENSYPKYTIVNAGCGTYASITINTPADSYSFDGGSSWTTNPTLTNLLGGNSYSIKVRKGASCYSYTNYAQIYSTYLPIPLANDYQTTLCDDLNNGNENVDLTQFNTNLISNSASFNFTYFKDHDDAENDNSTTRINNATSCNLSNSDNTVYVRVTSSSGCHKVVALKFTFIDSPVIVMEDSYILCEFKNVIINAGPFDGYLWSTGETTSQISITQPGNYWVTVFENHGALICSSTKSFMILLSNPATITSIATYDWTNSDNIITIFVKGLGAYEYSLDGITYQDGNQFVGLKNGVYKVFIRDKNECGIVTGDTFLLMYTNFFTPNDDTYNDTWKINFSEYEVGLTIKIFDRNGKFLKELGNNMGWDGTFNGKPLPSSDYWFLVTRADGREYRGHFTLKR